MFPILIQIGSLEIRSSHSFLVLAIVVGIVFASREARRAGFSKRDISTFWIAVVPFALGVGFLIGLLYWQAAWDVPEGTVLSNSGNLIAFGVILGALFLGWLIARLRKQPAGTVTDLIARTLPLMLAIYRIGCLLNGCCYGSETTSPFGIYLPGQNGEWGYRYPTQIIYILFDLALFIWLQANRNRRPFGLSLTHAFLIIFSAGHLLIDALRDLPPVLGPFNPQQLTAIAILTVALYVWFELRRTKI